MSPKSELLDTGGGSAGTFEDAYASPFDEKFGGGFPAANRGPGEGDLGPCLYFGPQGQRCSRRAIRGGFCAQHQPVPLAKVKKVAAPSRILAAVAAIVGILWPYVSDLLREILRWIHPH